MPQIGEVYSYPDYVYPDGDQSDKRVIVTGILASDDYVVARSTSQPYGRIRDPRCNHDRHYPSYYLGIIDDVFPLETWVTLERFDDHDCRDFDGRVANRVVTRIGALEARILRELLLCCARADDVTKLQQAAMQDHAATIR